MTPTELRAARKTLGLDAAQELLERHGFKVVPPKLESITDRFWVKVRKTDTCWLWEAANDRQGYGHNGQGGCDRRDQDRISDRQPVVDKGDRPGFDHSHENDDLLCFRGDIVQPELPFYEQGEKRQENDDPKLGEQGGV